MAAARALGAADTESDVLGVVSEHAGVLLGVRGCALSLLAPDGEGVRSTSTSDTDQGLATVDLPLTAQTLDRLGARDAEHAAAVSARRCACASRQPRTCAS